jgi:hypothetical protein
MIASHRTLIALVCCIEGQASALTRGMEWLNPASPHPTALSGRKGVQFAKIKFADQNTIGVVRVLAAD